MASTTSTFFLENVARFEMSSKTSVYTVYELTENGQVLSSMFDTKQSAVDFAHDFTNTNSQVYIYKSKCIKILDSPLLDEDLEDNTTALDTLAEVASNKLVEDYNSEDDEDYVQPEHVESEVESEYTDYDNDIQLEDDGSIVIDYGDLDGLFFHNYGKGYLLVPTQDTPFFGQKYLLNGWWNEKAQGWFFQKKYYNELVDHGALFVSKKSKSSKSTRSQSKSSSSTSNNVSFTDLSDVFTNPRELDGFSITTYGRGLLLTCAKSNKLFKNQEPYLLGNLGFWNAKAGGWFFKNEHLESLEVLGAKMIKEEPETSNSTIKHFNKAPKFTKYGRGWLLPSPNNKAFETHGKYFHGGFWMPKQNGWFFRTADKQKFLEQFN